MAVSWGITRETPEIDTHLKTHEDLRLSNGNHKGYRSSDMVRNCLLGYRFKISCVDQEERDRLVMAISKKVHG